MSVGLILLAAGGSSRMGTPKQLLVFRGRTLLRGAAEQAVDSGCRPVVVVVGAHAERLTPELAGLPVHVADNPAWRTGMGSSVRTGMEALLAAGEAVEGVVITVCDQPFCDAAAIRALVEGHAGGNRRIVSASYGGVCGVPALFDRTLFPELLALDGARGAQVLLEDHPQEVLAIPFASGEHDIDTPDDYVRLQTLSSSR